MSDALERLIQSHESRTAKAIEEIKQLEQADKPKYMIYLSRNDGAYTPICVQDFDLPDLEGFEKPLALEVQRTSKYDANRFYSQQTFETEELAQAAIDNINNLTITGPVVSYEDGDGYTHYKLGEHRHECDLHAKLSDLLGKNIRITIEVLD